MPFERPELPYAIDALAPHISKETLEYHYGKHHQAYVTNLNKLVINSHFENSNLEEIILKANGPIFNNAAQVWNHTFYWNSMSPNGGGDPSGKLLDAIQQHFETPEAFRTAFSHSAATNFGSGWTWLVQNSDGSLAIVNTSNAENPMKNGQKPLLVCDVWEHAYYIDYRNARPQYIDAFWNLVNWDFAASHLN